MKKRIPYFDIFLLLFVSIILALSLLSFKRINDLIKSSEWVNHSHSVVLNLEQVFSLVKDSEMAHRGFLLTKDSSFLQPYKNAEPKIYSLLSKLDSLTWDDPPQKNKLKDLSKLITLKIAEIKSHVISPGLEGKMAPVLINGKNLMDEIRALVFEIESTQQNLLNERIALRDNYESITPAFSLILVIFILLLIISSFLRIRKDQALISARNEELLRLKTFLQAILDSSSDIIITFDKNLNYSSINNAAEKTLGYKRQELLGKNPFDLFPQARFNEHHQMMIKALHGETNQIESIGTVLNPDIKVQTTFIPLLIDGEINGVLNIAKDITSLEKANEQILKTNELLELKNTELEDANSSLLSFNYIASHDLKEPLRKIQTFLKLLVDEESAKLSGNGKYYFERTIDAAKRMQSLIEALLDFSKTQLNEINFKPTDLNVILDELVKEFHDPLLATNGTIRYQDLPTILAVQPLIRQILSNLIGNSIKYSKKNQPLLISVTSEKVNKIEVQGKTIHKEYWKIVVRDNGIGFESQYSNKIFELFQRLHKGVKEYEGTGIGLTICKKLVQTHRGFIYAQSEAGEGATFTFLIPLQF